MDLATGSAGILLALHYALTPGASLLPYLSTYSSKRSTKGGETCLTS